MFLVAPIKKMPFPIFWDLKKKKKIKVPIDTPRITFASET